MNMRKPMPLLAFLLLQLPLSPTLAHADTAPVLFVVASKEGYGPVARGDLLQSAVEALGPDANGTVVVAYDKDATAEIVTDALANDPATVVTGIAIVPVDSDITAFEGHADELVIGFTKAQQERTEPAEMQVLYATPLCRALQLSLKPGDLISQTVIVVPAQPEAAQPCFDTVAQVILDRARSIGAADGVSAEAVFDETADTAQAAQAALRVISQRLIDNITDRNTRENNIYKVDEKIEVAVSLENVARSNPGQADARYRIGLDILIEMEGGPEELLEDVHIYEGDMSLRVPVDASYFQNWLTAGIRLGQPGEYTVTFKLTDLNADEDKPRSVDAAFDVVVIE
jgi:hypothetical protein